MMRVSYIAPGVSHFDDVFKSHHWGGLQRGGGLKDIKTLKSHNYHMRAGLLFGILGNVFRRTIPFLTNYVLPEAGNFARNLLSDIGNVPMKKNVKRNLIKSAKNIGKRVMNRGGGVARKNKTVKKKNGKKGKSNCSDVFSEKNMKF